MENKEVRKTKSKGKRIEFYLDNESVEQIEPISRLFNISINQAVKVLVMFGIEFYNDYNRKESK